MYLMKLEGDYTFEAPRDVVWDVLLDPQLLARVLPGCEGLEPLGNDQYKAVLKIQIGPVQGVFEGTVALSDINKPESYRMDINGKGAPGFVKGGGVVRLESQDSGTIMHYSGDAQVGGKIASVGQRLLDSSTRAIVRQSLDGIAGQVRANMEAAQAKKAGDHNPSSPSQPGSTVPSKLDFTLGVAGGVLSDLIPPERRALAITGAIVLLLILIFILTRAL
jgi:uncharacterized protein